MMSTNTITKQPPQLVRTQQITVQLGEIIETEMSMIAQINVTFESAPSCSTWLMHAVALCLQHAVALGVSKPHTRVAGVL